MLDVPRRLVGGDVQATGRPRARVWTADKTAYIAYAATACVAAVFAVQVFLLPLSTYLSVLNIDDSFYYFQIARNFAAGRFSTFDGVHLTNGYHPLWAVVLTPVFAVIRDPILAIRVVKMVELAFLSAGALLIMASGRKAGWPALLSLAIPISLIAMQVLYRGMETSIQVLLCAGLLYGLVQLFARHDDRAPVLGIGLICCLLPWARLETLTISLGAMLVVTTHAIWIDRGRRGVVLLSWALLAISVAGYFIYNNFVFGSAVPISGSIKNYWSSIRFSEVGGYDFLRNAKLYYWSYRRPLTECAGILVVAAGPWLLPAYRRPLHAAQHAIDLFIAILVAAFVARLAYASAFVNIAYDNSYYYVPYYLVHALTIAYLVSRALLLIDALARGSRDLSRPIYLAASAAALLVAGLQSHPWSLPDRWRQEGSQPSWLMSSYDGANWMNRNLPQAAVIGSPDSGALGYFSTRRVINLDGLVNETGFFSAMKNQSVERWIRAAGITHLANAVVADTSDGCAFIARGSAQTRPYLGSCTLLYDGLRFRESWQGSRDQMQFRVYAYAPKT